MVPRTPHTRAHAHRQRRRQRPTDHAPVEEVGGGDDLLKRRDEAHHDDGGRGQDDGARGRVVRGLAPERGGEHAELSHSHELEGVAAHLGEVEADVGDGGGEDDPRGEPVAAHLPRHLRVFRVVDVGENGRQLGSESVESVRCGGRRNAIRTRPTKKHKSLSPHARTHVREGPVRPARVGDVRGRQRPQEDRQEVAHDDDGQGRQHGPWVRPPGVPDLPREGGGGVEGVHVPEEDAQVGAPLGLVQLWLFRMEGNKWAKWMAGMYCKRTEARGKQRNVPCQGRRSRPWPATGRGGRRRRRRGRRRGGGSRRRCRRPACPPGRCRARRGRRRRGRRR